MNKIVTRFPDKQAYFQLKLMSNDNNPTMTTTGNMAVSGRTREKSSNPFYEDEEDVDDFEFLSHPQQGRGGYLLGNDQKSSNTEWETRRLQLLEEQHQIEQRTLQATNSSLGLLHESEQIGIATADELVRQREQLENVEDKVDEISATMRMSQKHLTAMKSIFGGIKSYFSRSPSTTTPTTTTLGSTSSEEPDHTSVLQETVDKVKASSAANSQEHHPAFQLRGINTSESPQAEFGSKMDRDNSPTSYSQSIEQKIDNNLEQMNLGLDRLKYLAIGLGDEIEEQNEMLDRITGKVEKSEDTLQYQNRQIRRILKK